MHIDDLCDWFATHHPMSPQSEKPDVFFGIFSQFRQFRVETVLVSADGSVLPVHYGFGYGSRWIIELTCKSRYQGQYHIDFKILIVFDGPGYPLVDCFHYPILNDFFPLHSRNEELILDVDEMLGWQDGINVGSRYWFLQAGILATDRPMTSWSQHLACLPFLVLLKMSNRSGLIQLRNEWPIIIFFRKVKEFFGGIFTAKFTNFCWLLRLRTVWLDFEVAGYSETINRLIFQIHCHWFLGL